MFNYKYQNNILSILITNIKTMLNSYLSSCSFRLVYKTNKFPDEPVFLYEEGDGTVNLRSLESCKQWITKQKQPVHVEGFEGSDHMGILKDKRTLDYIYQYISGSKKEFV